MLTPVQKIEFLGLEKLVSEGQNLLKNLQSSILELTKLIGLLSLTIQVVLPARLNFRFLKMHQTSSLTEELSYLDESVLNDTSKIERKWWVQNSELCNGQALIQQRDGGNMESNLNRGDVVCSGNEKPYKCLRILSHKTNYTNVLENLEAQSHSSPVGQHGSFNISVKDRGYPEFQLFELAKGMRDHLVQCGINLTAEYFPSKLNLTADWK